MSLLVFTLFVAALLAIYAADPPWSQSEHMAFVRVMIIALPLVAWIARSGLGLFTTVRYAAIWAALGLAIVVVYGYQTEISAIGRRTLAALRLGQS